MNAERKPSRAVAEEMDSVAWGYDPEDEFVSPLTKTAAFFKAMPWDGDDVAETSDPGE